MDQELMEEAHEMGLTITWCVLFNIAVVSYQFKEKIWAAVVHTICGVLIGLATLTFSLMFLAPKQGFTVTIEEDGYIIYIHGVIGLIIISAAFLQWFTGFFTKINQKNATLAPQSIIARKKLHVVVGWILGYICKANVVMVWYPQTQFIIVIVWEILCTCLIVYLKFFRVRMESIGLYQPVIGKEIYQISDIGEIKGKQNMVTIEFVIFADDVYDMEPLRENHPAGFEIIEQLTGREIDRFVYGMYSSEYTPAVLPYSHSARFLDLLGSPIARLIHPNPYTGFGATYQLTAVQIKLVEIVSPTSQIYMLGLTSLMNDRFIFNGYTNLKQYGQYYSLTINDKNTRLYTSVNCLCPRNVGLMQNWIKGFAGYGAFNFPYEKEAKSGVEIEMSVRQNMLKNQQETFKKAAIVSFLPILVKIYQQGKLTGLLKNSGFKDNKLILSKPRGRGLQLDHTPQGVIVIIAGGTGLFPFLDFIDSMFKTQLLEQKHPDSSIITANDLIIHSGVFKKWSAVLLLAINSPQDIPPLTLLQMNYLSSNSNRMQCVLKIKQNSQQLSSVYKRFEYTSQRFEERISKEIKRSNLARVWICGPPRMNSDTVKSLSAEPNFSMKKVLLV